MRVVAPWGLVDQTTMTIKDLIIVGNEFHAVIRVKCIYRRTCWVCKPHVWSVHVLPEAIVTVIAIIVPS